jgi:hypothetical protein
MRSTKIHKGEKNVNPTPINSLHHLGMLRRLCTMVFRNRKTQCTHDQRRSSNALENPQTNHKLPAKEMAAHRSTKRKNHRLQMRLRLHTPAEKTHHKRHSKSYHRPKAIHTLQTVLTQQIFKLANAAHAKSKHGPIQLAPANTAS